MQITPGERGSGALGADRLRVAALSVDLVGYVVLEDLVPREVCAEIRAALRERIAAGAGKASETKQTSMFPPFTPPFSTPEVVANPIVLQVARAVLGAEFACNFYNTNIALPGSSEQHVHVDYWNKPDPAATPTIPHLVYHLALCDFTEQNGSTEMWPGTHRYPMTKDEAYEQARPGGTLDQLAPLFGSVRANLPVGSAVLRSPCIWHRAMPNRTDEPREMVSLLYIPPSNGFVRDPEEAKITEIAGDVLEALPDDARPIFAGNPIV